MAADVRPFELPTTDGLLLRGEVWGGGDLALTFVHGSGLTVQSYYPAFRALAGRARVHALNSRGHGSSGNPADFPSYEAPVADLRSLVETRLRPPAVLSGHSFGALISLQLAAEEPGLAAGLLLLEPLVPWRRSEEWLPAGEGAGGELIAKTQTRRAQWESRADAERWLGARSIYRDWSAEALERFCDSALEEQPDGTVTLACPPWLEAASYAGRPGKEIFQWAERVQVPAVVLRGRESMKCILRGAEDLADAFTMGTVITVEGDHTFPQEYPESTGAALAQALEILARGTGARRRPERSPSRAAG